MNLDEMKTKIQSAGERAWYEGDFSGLEQIYAADYLAHRSPFPDARGLESVKQYIADTRLAYSDIQMIYDEWVCAEDAIAYRYHGRMKHTGTSPSLPIPPTGKELTLEGCIIVHVKDGKVIEEWEYSDYLGFMQQLGLVPALA